MKEVSNEMNPIENFSKVCELTQRQVVAAKASPEGQTGCSDWNATELVNHMVVTLGMWADIFSGQEPKHDPFNPPHILGDDMVADFEAAAARAVHAFSADGAMETVLQTPAGEMPGAAAITFPTWDVYVHGWDLEQATGLVGEYPDDLTAFAKGFAQQAFGEGRPPGAVGPEVTVPESASPLHKMLAFSGRDPQPAGAS